MRNLYRFVVFCLCTLNAMGQQHTNLPLSHQANLSIEKEILSTYSNTSFQPLIKSSVNEQIKVDSLMETKFENKQKSWLLKKLFDEHLVVLKGADYQVVASPILHLALGKDIKQNKNTFVNTRGIWVEGDIGDKVSFYSAFAENQAIFPNYLDSNIKRNWVVPGQGFARSFKDNGFDYAMASGYVAIKPAKQFVLQFGHGKHFIGDGYRSLLLSDNAFNYPFLRVQTSFWKVQYTNLYAELQDINYFKYNGLDNENQMGYAKKYMSAHYLSVALNQKITISIYESVIWRANHAPGSKGFDVNYLNPIALLRPIEFSINSPDNVMVGVNTKYRTTLSSYLYGQLVLDEFSINDLRARNNFWGNKFGYQIGGKMYDAFGVEKLVLQTEFNLVRPYTYAHHNPIQNYAHYNQPLAHPLGANFSENIIMANYRKHRWTISTEIMLAKYGGKIPSDPTSYGNDVYMSSGNYAEESGMLNIGIGRPDRDNDGSPDDFGMELYQGNLTHIQYFQCNLGYILNPISHLQLDMCISKRTLQDEFTKVETFYYTIGLKTDLFNYYYDF